LLPLQISWIPVTNIFHDMDSKKDDDDLAAEAPMTEDPTRTVTTDIVSESPPSESEPITTMGTTSLSGKKRGRNGGGVDGGDAAAAPLTSVSTAAAAAASQMTTLLGLHGLASLLSAGVLSATGGPSNTAAAAAASSNAASTGSSCTLPTLEQVQQTARRFLADAPPHVHWSKTDSAPQLKIVGSDDDNHHNDRLVCRGGMRGYRMARASHGVAPAGGNYYYECVLQEPPSVREIIHSMPSNVRISKKLQEEMQAALKMEEERETQMAQGKTAAAGAAEDDDENIPKQSFGSHVRLGWSMRTGDLQAPVGYDKWSYGIRDIGGSKIHRSQREDHWGGEEFGPGDVIGCAISMVPDSTMEGVPPTGSSSRNSLDSSEEPMSHQQHQAHLQTPQHNHNHIRFFKNGYPMGEFVLSKGKREGGAAFIIPDGVYYPAISLYMGACVKVNFGPNFIYQPRKLPAGMKLRPLSDVCSPPVTFEEASAKIAKERPFRKPDMHQKFLGLVEAEVKVMQESYKAHRTKHVLDVMEERKKRGLNTDNLENDEFYPQDATVTED
jgi:hypothetical protein